MRELYFVRTDSKRNKKPLLILVKGTRYYKFNYFEEEWVLDWNMFGIETGDIEADGITKEEAEEIIRMNTKN